MSKIDENTPEQETDGASNTKEDPTIDQIKEEVHRLSKELGISLEEAERSLYGSYGVDLPVDRINISALSDLEVGMRGVTMKARLVTVHKGNRKDGEEYHWGMLGDSDSTVRFSAWADFDYSPGDAILIQNALVREFRGEKEVSINDKCLISSVEDMDGLVPPMEDEIPGTIAELRPESKSIDLECRITELHEIEIGSRDGGTRKIQRGTVADRSGSMDFTSWNILPIELGSCYRMIGGYVKEYKGRNRLNLNAGTMIRGLHDDRLPSMEELTAPRDARIVDLLKGNIPGRVRLRGVILDIRSGSGIFRRCEECGRKLVKSQCTVHGRMKGEEDMAVRAVFDDGSGTCMLRGDRRVVENVLDRPMERISQEVRESMDPDIVADELTEKLMGRSCTVSGDGFLDDYGLSINLSNIDHGFGIDGLKDEVSLLLEVVQ